MRIILALALSLTACAHTPPVPPKPVASYIVYVPAICSIPSQPAQSSAEKQRQIKGVESELEDVRKQAQAVATNPNVPPEGLDLVQRLYRHAEAAKTRAKAHKTPEAIQNAKGATEAVKAVTEVLKQK